MMGLIALFAEWTEDVVGQELTDIPAVGVVDWFARTACVFELSQFLPRTVLVEMTDVSIEITFVIGTSAFGRLGRLSLALAFRRLD